MGILEEIGGFLKGGSNLSDLADYLGTGVEEVKRPVGAAVSLLVAAVAKRSTTEAGGEALFKAAKDAGGSALEHVGAPFGRDEQVDVGERLVDALLGSQRENIEDGLASKSGMSVDQIQDLLPAMAPPVMAAMGRRVSRERMGKATLLSELEGDRSTMQREGLGSLLSLLDGGDDAADAKHFAQVMKGFNDDGGVAALLPAAKPVQGDQPLTSISTTPDVANVPVGDGAGPAIAVGATGAAAGAAAVGASVYEDKAAAAATPATAGGAGGGLSTQTLESGPVGGEEEFYGSPADNRMMWILGGLLALLLLALLIWQCGGDDGDETGTDGESPTEVPSTDGDGATGTVADGAAPPVNASYKEGFLLDKVSEKGSFAEFLSAVEFANLTDTLEAEGEFTVFTPTDAAFSQLDPALRNDPEIMREILSYHVVAGVIPSTGLVTGNLDTAAGIPVEVVTIDGSADVQINSANVTLPDQQAVNGVFHVVDQVLLPPEYATAAPGGTLNDELTLNPITFEPASASITAEGQAELDKVVAYLTENAVNVEIGGYTDSTGDEAANLVLSQQRADGVRQYLVDNGIAAETLTAVGFGIADPIADNSTPEGQAANRRIEFKVL